MPVDRQHFGDQVFYAGIDIRLEFKLMVLDVVIEIFNVSSRPRCFSMKHLVKNDTHAPHIAAIAKLLACKHFWSSIERRSKAGKFLGLGGVLYHSTETKIAEFCDPLLKKNVGRFDVSVDDLSLEEDIVTAHEVAHEGDGFVLTDALGHSERVEVSLEVAVLAELQNDIEMLSAAEAVMHLDDEGRGDGLEGGDFALDLLLDMVGEFVDVDDLDGYLHAVLALAVVDRPAGSLPERLCFSDAIVGDLLDGRCFTHI
jgi:hypothetical protein